MDLHYFCKPGAEQGVDRPVAFVGVSDFLTDEPACRHLWDLLATQFHTRRKFLAVWPGVRYVALSRDAAGAADGFVLVTAAVNWQIDYVVVRPDRRGLGVAAAMVKTALNHAARLGVPYVMLTSRPALRPLYESCGFAVVDPAGPGRPGAVE